MTKMISAQHKKDESLKKLSTAVFFGDHTRCAIALPAAFRRAALLLVISLGLFANVARAQFIGITKPFDPATLTNPELAPIGEAVVTGNGIEYHGGPVMLGPHNIYFIWYGNFSGNPALTILPDLINGFGGSQYFNTNTTYGDATGNIANTATLVKQIFDNYSQGKALTGTTFANPIVTALNSGALPMDPNGIYFLLTSPDVTLTVPPSTPGGTPQGFCTTFCGFHTNGTLGATDIKVAFIGDPATQCPAIPGKAGCSAQALSPNGNEGADAMANVMTHELNEAITDPDGDAWFHTDTAGERGGCLKFKFGTTFTSLNGAHANIVLSGRQFLIQSNWLNSGGGSCAMGFSAQAPSGLTFVPVPPCRVADTRNPAGAFGGPALIGNATREFDIPNSACNIPSTAQAYSVNARSE